MPTMTVDGPVWDTLHLSGAQQSGAACVACGKRWPRPRIPVGHVPDGTRVMACEECSDWVRHEQCRLIAARLLRGAALAVAAGAAPATDPRAAVHLAGHHYATRDCANGCQMCQAADTALIAVASHVHRTEHMLVDVDPPADLELATRLLRAWLDSENTPAAVVSEALTGAARDLEA